MPLRGRIDFLIVGGQDRLELNMPAPTPPCLSPQLEHELFSAALAFQAAQPWQHVANTQGRPDGVNPLVAAVVARARLEPTMRRPS